MWVLWCQSGCIVGIAHQIFPGCRQLKEAGECEGKYKTLLSSVKTRQYLYLDRESGLYSL